MAAWPTQRSKAVSMRLGSSCGEKDYQKFSSARATKRVLVHLPIACGDAGQQPGYDLPVSANPAMTSCSIGKICRGVIFVKNITQQARAGKAALKKIVTEHLVVRESVRTAWRQMYSGRKCPFRCMSLRRHVLVAVRNCARVGPMPLFLQLKRA